MTKSVEELEKDLKKANTIFYSVFVVACLCVIAMIHTIDSAEHLQADDHVTWTQCEPAECQRRQGKVNNE